MADKATIELAADNSRLKRELDEGEGMVRRWGGSVQGVIRTLAAALAAYKLFDWGRSLVGAAVEDELSVRRLEAVLKAAGPTLQVTAGHVHALAEELMRTTRFGDDATRSAATMLAAFGNIRGDTFIKTIRAAADLAELLGTDLPSAAQQLGRVLSQPEQGLGFLERRVGSLTKAQMDSIKQFTEMGDVASAQGVILDAITAKVGGLAEELGDTVAGKIARFKNDIGELGEAIGAKLITALENIGTKGRSAFDILTASVMNWGKTWDMIVKGASLSMVQFWERFKFFFSDELPAIVEDAMDAAIEKITGVNPREAATRAWAVERVGPEPEFAENQFGPQPGGGPGAFMEAPRSQRIEVETGVRQRGVTPARTPSALEQQLQRELDDAANRWAAAVDEANKPPPPVEAAPAAGTELPNFGGLWKGLGKQWGDLSKAFKDKGRDEKGRATAGLEDLVALNARISGAAASPEARAAKAAEDIKARMDEAVEGRRVVNAFLGNVKTATERTAKAAEGFLKKNFGLQ